MKNIHSRQAAANHGMVSLVPISIPKAKFIGLGKWLKSGRADRHKGSKSETEGAPVACDIFLSQDTWIFLSQDTWI